MAKLNSVQRLKPEDFNSEYAQLVEQLGEILNEHMQQVVDLANGRIDFENLNQNIIQFDMTVDGNGTPIGSNQLNVGKTSINGISVISAYNNTNSQVYATGTPFITQVPQGNGLVTIRNITSLPANNKFSITAIVY